MEKFYKNNYRKLLLLMIGLFCTVHLLGRTHTETFDGSNSTRITSLNRTIEGVQFNFLFTPDGGGGSSLFVRNDTGTPITVQGYRAGSAVGASTTIITGQASNVTSGAVVDQVLLTATDFFNVNIDNFTWSVPASTLPVATAPSAPTVNEDEINVALADNIQIEDADGNNQMVSFTVTGGIVTLGTTGITFGGSGNSSASFTASGTLANINAALDAATFTPTPNLYGNNAGSISFTSNDGTANSNTASVTFNINGVNDDPTFVGIINSITVVEDEYPAYLRNALSSGIFQDIDAGSNDVSLTITTSQGNLAIANPASYGISQSGHNSPTLTLTGPAANIESFLNVNTNIALILPNNLSGPNAVTITLTANDNGNTGVGGGNDVVVGTVNVNITPVNDAPTVANLIPDQIAPKDEAFNFQFAANTFQDVDPGNTLAYTAQLAAGGALPGWLSFNAATRTFSGTPTSANLGTVSIKVTADDGNLGTISDSFNIVVVAAVNDAPVNAVPDAQAIDQDNSLVFSTGNSNLISISDVDAGGGTIRTTLTATNGLITLESTTGLTFLIGNGAGDGTMTFEGTIADINTALNGMTFVPTAGYNGTASIQITTNDLGLTGQGGSLTDSDIISIAVNALEPKITTVNTNNPNGTYKLSDVIRIMVTFSQAVFVDITGGLPKLLLETGNTDRQATYVSGSGSNILMLNYTVQEDDVSTDLDYASASALSLNGGAIQNGSNVNALLTLPARGSANSIAGQRDIVIDGVKPLVTSVDVPANGIYKAGNMLDLRVNFNENVNVDATGSIPHINMVIGAATYQATYVGGTGTKVLTFRYTIQSGDMDMDGIAVGALVLNAGTVKDLAGNDAVLTLNNVASTTGVLVNTTSPTVVLSTSATSPINQAFTANITFSEAVTGFTLGDIAATNATLSNLQTINNISYTVLITPIADGSLSIQIPAGVAVNIGNNNNTASNTLNFTVDASDPVINSVNVPANGIYKGGDQLNFTINYSENVIINTSAGIPSLNVALDGVTRSAIYVSGTGSNSLIFRYTIVTGDLDQDGIALGASLVLNAATLRDAAGNNASLALNGVGTTTNVRVDAVAPAIPSNFAATAGNAENSLTWVANTESDLESYKIYAGTSNNPTTLLTTIPASGITYLHNALLNGNIYYYRISAVDQVGNESALSPSIFAKPMASQVITFDQPSAKTYGQEAFDLVGSSDSGLALTYTSSDPTIASISGKTVNILKVGSVQITATQLGNEMVKPATPVTRSLDIHKTTLTITAENKEKFAGTANPPLTVKYAGFAFNETLEVLDKAPTVSTSATTLSPAGDYPILVSGAVASNYELTYVNGILKVKPGAPTDITMESSIVYENGPAKTKAGAFSSVSGDPSATYTYSLVAGTSDTDNALFAIEDNSLFTKNTFDFENKSMYSIRIKTTTQYGLSFEKAFTVTITDVNEAPTLASISNSTICYTAVSQTIPLTGISAGPEKNQAVTLSVNSDNPTLFQNLKVSDSENNTSLSYSIKEGRTGTANITVTVTDDGGIANGGVNTSSKTFVLTVNALPVIAITSDKGSDISKGDIVVLTASGATSYVWTANNGIISGHNTATLTVRPTENITYTVTGTNASGCSITQSFSIKVAEDLKLIANNIVTPNGDGYNDKWIVQNIDVYPDNLIKIFDRAGRLLYSKKRYDNSWDASYNGNPLNEGTYYYIMEFTGSTRKFKGYITVVREN